MSLLASPMSHRTIALVCAVTASLISSLISSIVVAHPVRQLEPRIASARIENPTHETLATVLLYSNRVIVSLAELRGQTPAFVCYPSTSCARVTAVVPCEQSESPNSDCEPGSVWIQHEPLVPPQRRIVPPDPQWVDRPPPVIVPPDPCTDRQNPAWETGFTSSVGFSVASHDGRPHLGFTIAPGVRRFVPPTIQSSWQPSSCSNPEPNLARVFGGAWIGSELGFDLHGHVHWSLPVDTSTVSGALGFAPIARIMVARGRLRIPSVLGALLPEFGYRIRTIKYDDMGALLPRSGSAFSLYFRPAGFSVSYILVHAPSVALELNIAPWFEIPLSGQPSTIGFSGFVQVSMMGWN